MHNQGEFDVGAAQPGDQVAFQEDTESEWVLGRVLSWMHETGQYQVSLGGVLSLCYKCLTRGKNRSAPPFFGCHSEQKLALLASLHSSTPFPLSHWLGLSRQEFHVLLSLTRSLLLLMLLLFDNVMQVMDEDDNNKKLLLDEHQVPWTFCF